MQSKKTFALVTILMIMSSMFSMLSILAPSFASMHVYAWAPLYPESTNLAPMPYGWAQWGYGGPDYEPVYFFIDYDILGPSGNPSIRLQEDLGYKKTRGSVRDAFPYPEYWIPISPGDHVVFFCWMKTEVGPTNPHSGARMGIDFYDFSGLIGATSAPNGEIVQEDSTYELECANYVNWNTPEWSYRKIEFIVRSTVLGKEPKGMIPWIMVVPCDWSGNAWFADCEFYVNPIESQEGILRSEYRYESSTVEGIDTKTNYTWTGKTEVGSRAIDLYADNKYRDALRVVEARMHAFGIVR